MRQTTFRPTRALGTAALALATTLGFAACGSDEKGDSAPPETSATEHNEADVAFATEMIPHHAQALTMVDQTRERTLDPEVEQLVEQIRDAQAPEIETMTDWLTVWGEDVPETMRDHANAPHDDGDTASDSMGEMDMEMPGMMSAEEMAALEGAPEGQFQQMWLEMMIAHHEGAVEMAETELAEGKYEPAVELAQDIVDAQAEEIETMEEILDS